MFWKKNGSFMPSFPYHECIYLSCSRRLFYDNLTIWRDEKESIYSCVRTFLCLEDRKKSSWHQSSIGMKEIGEIWSRDQPCRDWTWAFTWCNLSLSPCEALLFTQMRLGAMIGIYIYWNMLEYATRKQISIYNRYFFCFHYSFSFFLYS